MIYLQATITAKTEYTGKSKFQFWNSVRGDDSITINLALKRAGRSRGGMYAPTLELINNRTLETTQESYNNVHKYLEKIGI